MLEVEYDGIIHLEVVLGYKNTPIFVEDHPSIAIRVISKLHEISYTQAKLNNPFWSQVQWLNKFLRDFLCDCNALDTPAGGRYSWQDLD